MLEILLNISQFELVKVNQIYPNNILPYLEIDEAIIITNLKNLVP